MAAEQTIFPFDAEKPPGQLEERGVRWCLYGGEKLLFSLSMFSLCFPSSEKNFLELVEFNYSLFFWNVNATYMVIDRWRMPYVQEYLFAITFMLQLQRNRNVLAPCKLYKCTCIVFAFLNLQPIRVDKTLRIFIFAMVNARWSHLSV